jgi:hypothetical protein
MGQTAAKRVTAKDPREKLAHRRMTVLELAERLATSARRVGAAASTGPASTTGSGASSCTGSTG